MKHYSLLFLFIGLSLTSFMAPRYSPPAKDYLSIPGPISMNNVNYLLSWSSHPNATYYKQEYTPAGTNPEKFTKMIMVEAVVGKFVTKDVLKAKMDELAQRKKTDPLTNYSVIENAAKGEYILDFIIGEGQIAEWNAYRYASLPDNKGILLFALSKRAYGDAIPNFLKALKTERTADINTIANFKLPAPKIQ